MNTLSAISYTRKVLQFGKVRSNTRSGLFHVLKEYWTDLSILEAVLTTYGSWLFERRDYKQAAIGAGPFSKSG